MMAEETLKTIERLSQNGWQSDAETVLALVAEIERQREEIAALRHTEGVRMGLISPAAHEDRMQRLMAEIVVLRTDARQLRADKARLNEQLERVNFVAAARAKDLQTLMESRQVNAPAPEPAPRRIIPNVRVKYTATDAAHRSGQLGVIVGSAVDYLEVEFEDGLVEGVKRTELQSV